MSHHVHLLPGILPLEKAQAPLKKRRLRKTSSGEVMDAEDIGELSDAVFTLEDEEDGAPKEDISDPTVKRRLVSGWFSGPTMKALLQAQEGLKSNT